LTGFSGFTRLTGFITQSVTGEDEYICCFFLTGFSGFTRLTG